MNNSTPDSEGSESTAYAQTLGRLNKKGLGGAVRVVTGVLEIAQGAALGTPHSPIDPDLAKVIQRWSELPDGQVGHPGDGRSNKGSMTG